jgi:tripartite-type tricarboxylate transporter receptor subunit TctC
LAVTAIKRLPDFPDLATVAEIIPGFEANGWFALLTKSGVRGEIVRKINDDLADVLGQDELEQKFRTLGTYPHSMPPSETVAFIGAYERSWPPRVRALVKPQ